MGKVKELRVRKGFIRKGIRVEYTVTADVDDEQDLFAAKERLEGIVDGWISSQPEFKAAIQTVKSQSTKKAETTVEEVKKKFPENLQSLLKFSDSTEYVIIEPRQFLGTENFAEIARIVRDAGGDYVSAGKESHFRVPKKRD
jgi:intein-encoded DNA endonuclease-like protein